MTQVREARPEERAAVAGVLDAAALAVDHDALPGRIAAGSVLVAHEDDRVLGALVLDRTGESETGTCRIEAVAVRPGRRGQGIGTALVRAAASRCDRLVATCDEGVHSFYARLGFDLTATGSGRYRADLAE